MPLLHVYDSSDWTIRETAWARGGSHAKLPTESIDAFIGGIDGLIATGQTFDRILFETHGNSGIIAFGNEVIDAAWWGGRPAGRRWYNLTTAYARVYFNGCNVAEGPEGWAFLEAVAAAFLTPGGGTVFGQTSLGLANPFSGHVIHLWGSVRTLFVDYNGNITERFEQ